jgi:flavin-dependent dehydrogenase
MTQQKRVHAIVIGGGIAGLLAVRVLADSFVNVTLLERDHYPKEPSFRPGIPQGHHVHTMLLKGQRTLEKLFPGLREQLRKHGAIERAYGAESLYYYGGGRCPRLPPVLLGWNCSRLLVEWVIHQELLAWHNVSIMEGVEVIHLLSEEGAVCGVQYRERNEDTLANAIQDLRADFVVDASGVTSSICRWLEELGYQRPQEQVVNAHMGYATRMYLPPQDWSGWKGILIQGSLQERRGGTLMEIEGGRWMVVLAGSGGNYPPTDDEGYLEFARRLPDPALYEAISSAQPISPISGYRRMENRRRYLERGHVPAGLIVIGDALCAFNPVYGQGMSVAALETQVLDACLRSHVSMERLTRLFQKKVAHVLAFPWRLAASADARPDAASKGFRYMDHVLALLPHDPKVLLTFLKVMHLLISPLALFSPPLVIKVLRQSRQHVRATK